jgi:hypothetical protein
MHVMGEKKIGRLALRHEGTLWVAYYAMPDTMDGAIFLGSIAMTIVTKSPARKLMFADLMKEGVADIIEAKTGVRPFWPDGFKPAPESERGGQC